METKNQYHVAYDFFASLYDNDLALYPMPYIEIWLERKMRRETVFVEEVPIHLLKQWHIEQETGNIKHNSGRFFSIEGVRVKTNAGNIPEWDQPIINQPEIGILGIITKKINGILHFLMQAKIEPGNINFVQLSPTLQATRSNYMRVHQGKTPLFLEYFNGEKKVRVLLDQLQSEQGGRFLKKRNRNIIVEINKNDLDTLPPNFIWVTLEQLKHLIRKDNVVNMDTRTVISGIPLPTEHDANKLSDSHIDKHRFDKAVDNSFFMKQNQLHSLTEIISWITNLKTHFELETKKIPLNTVKNWYYDGNAWIQSQHRYFRVIGVDVQIGNREVIFWDQPMIQPTQEGVIAFLVKTINGIDHFLVQAKVEVGNFDILELAPTVQCLTGNYREGKNQYTVPFISDVIDAPHKNILYSAMQSEEGGRFFQEQNLNRIVRVGDDFPIEVPPNYYWMTLYQLMNFIQYNNYLNIAARSLIAAWRS